MFSSKHISEVQIHHLKALIHLFEVGLGHWHIRDIDLFFLTQRDTDTILFSLRVLGEMLTIPWFDRRRIFSSYSCKKKNISTMKVQRRLSDGINGICQLLIIQGNKISGWEQISGQFLELIFCACHFLFAPFLSCKRWWCKFCLSKCRIKLRGMWRTAIDWIEYFVNIWCWNLFPS